MLHLDGSKLWITQIPVNGQILHKHLQDFADVKKYIPSTQYIECHQTDYKFTLPPSRKNTLLKPSSRTLSCQGRHPMLLYCPDQQNIY